MSVKGIIMKLETKRLELSTFREEDKERLVELLNDERITSVTTIPYPYSLEDASNFLEHIEELKKEGTVNLAIRLKETGELIGGIGLYNDEKHKRAMAGYWLTPSYWSQGIMTEALKRMIEYGFSEMGLIRIEAHHVGHNSASGKVMEKAGMIKEGHFRSHIIRDGVVHDSIHYAILKDD